MTTQNAPFGGEAEPGRAAAPPPAGDPASRGRTQIADGVVAKIAETAVREIPGVHSLGSGMARAIGAVRQRVPSGRASAGAGVGVEVGETETAIDLDLVVEFGAPIPDVCDEVRRGVVHAVESATGLAVVEVNITVSDVRLPDEPDDPDAADATPPNGPHTSSGADGPETGRRAR
ncbi:Asp23/Gls24 family envelope stress response protein [Allostreptomyces psammosilenae]|uniref:Putative alkaline shock family protein YloU n=1 Tax=Allostreptomyces psammosilenae TaxID=1892865 RepID=A0A852ZYF4_9ACTN|nr:Asp23/Gls24 family envelope stress response protein [Allostreptomyces psammosilenae]NYI03312.1 putative alkaline shock family protein YloU [Allostreptomyces psammosilenae]